MAGYPEKPPNDTVQRAGCMNNGCKYIFLLFYTETKKSMWEQNDCWCRTTGCSLKCLSLISNLIIGTETWKNCRRCIISTYRELCSMLSCVIHHNATTTKTKKHFPILQCLWFECVFWVALECSLPTKFYTKQLFETGSEFMVL